MLAILNMLLRKGEKCPLCLAGSQGINQTQIPHLAKELFVFLKQGGPILAKNISFIFERRFCFTRVDISHSCTSLRLSTKDIF